MERSTLRFAALAVGVALAASVSHAAEKAAASEASTGSTLTRLGAKISLECRQNTVMSKVSNGVDLVRNPLPLTEGQKRDGFVVTGGGCQLFPALCSFRHWLTLRARRPSPYPGG